MQHFLPAIVLCTQLGLAASIFEDGEAPWDDDYNDAPGWVATVQAYREAEYINRERLQQSAGEDAVQIALVMSIGVVVFFGAMAISVWKVADKDSAKLHAYIQEHHQDADALEHKRAEHERVGLGQMLSDDAVQYRVEGRFGAAYRTEQEVRSDESDTLTKKLAKRQQRKKHVASAVERGFVAVDTDNSGELTRNELKEFLVQMKEPHSDEILDRLMANFDPDQSGTVSFEEFRDGWEEYNVLAVKNAESGGSSGVVESSLISGSKRAARQQQDDVDEYT